MRLFSHEEILRRVEGLREQMERRELDAVITTSFHNTLYYSGFWMFPFGRFYCAVIPKEGPLSVIAPNVNEHRMRLLSWAEDLRVYGDRTQTVMGGVDELRPIFAERLPRARKVGIEEDVLPIRTFEALRTVLQDVEFEDISDEMMLQRLIKSEEELQVLRTNAEMTDVSLQALVDAVEEGRTESELTNVALAALDAELARRYPDLETFGSAVFGESGERTTMPHSLATGRKIRRGDNLVFNVLGNLQGYYISNERTLFVGDVRPELEAPFEAVMEAHEWMLETIKPGVRCNEIANGVSQILDKHGGYGRYQAHGPGHDCGILAYFWGRGEKANFRHDNETVLAKNMVVTVEPGIYLPGVGGIRHCDVVALTEDGNELLTNFRRGRIVT